MKSDQIRSDQIVSGKGKKESGWFLGALLLYPYSYFIYTSAAQQGKRKKEIT